MPRPTTKSDLIDAANDQLTKMWLLIDSMTEEKQNAPFNFGDLSNKKEAHWERDKNMRDLLIHLYEWHQLLLNWVSANQAGVSRPFLPEPYNWKTYPQMNVGFWEKHQSTPYNMSKELVEKSHASVMSMIDTFSNDALFTKKYFP